MNRQPQRKDPPPLLQKRSFTYTGAVMTLPTGVQAVAENNYGRPDEAYAWLEKDDKNVQLCVTGFYL